MFRPIAVGIATCLIAAAAASSARADGQPPTLIAPPSITGFPNYDETLVAQPATWSGSAPIAITRQWQRCDLAGYSDAVRASDPLAFWELGDQPEAPPYTAYASAGSGEYDGSYDGFYNGGIWGVPGALVEDPDTAVQFQSGQLVSVPPVEFDAGNFAVELWFKTSGSTSMYSLWTTGGVSILRDLFGPLEGQVSDGTTTVVLAAPSAYADDAWHQAVLTRTGNTFILFVDGAQVASATAALGDVDGPATGATIGSTNYIGAIDEVSVYQHALSIDAVQHHRAEALGEACTDILGATGTTYTVTAADMSRTLRVVETATNSLGSASATSTHTDPGRGTFSYAQAVALGLVQAETPLDWGLPPCEPVSGDGYATSEELDAAVAAAPDETQCAFDHSDATIVLGMPPPTPATNDSCPGPEHRHLGGLTTDRFRGGYIKVKVTDPDIHPADSTRGKFEQVEARVLVRSSQTCHPVWSEIGWMEPSYGDRQMLYTFWSEDHPRQSALEWHRQLRTGSYQAFRARGCDDGTCLEWFTNGKWRGYKRTTSPHCARGSGITGCFIEEYQEVFSNTGHWPDLTASGYGVDFEPTKLKSSSGWDLWVASTKRSSNIKTSPYVTCWTHDYYAFTARKAAGC